MRISLWVALVTLWVSGAAAGQETHFATGPQYLMTSGSALFAQPISTPSLSLRGPALQTGATNASTGLIAGAQTQTIIMPPSDALPVVDFFPIYYGVGAAGVMEINLSGASAVREELPASIAGTGVWQVTTATALRERGFGVTLPEAASYWKSHVRHAGRVYTNDDIERLRSGKS